MGFQIYNEDCLVGMGQIPDASVDLTVTSPPYDNLRTYNRCVNDFKFEPTAQELWRVTKDGGVVVWIVNDATINGSETGTSFRQALYFKDIGFNLHDTMIWQKCGVVYTNSNRYYANFEYMFVFSKGRPKTANLIADVKNIHAGEKIHGRKREPDGSLKLCNGAKVGRVVKEFGVRTNIWKILNAGNSKYAEYYKHPAMFPLQLAEDHIKSWSNEGELVLDCFLGSGTTAVAALNLNRRFIGYEINREYYKIAQKRIDEALAKKAQELF